MWVRFCFASSLFSEQSNHLTCPASYEHWWVCFWPPFHNMTVIIYCARKVVPPSSLEFCTVVGTKCQLLHSILLCFLLTDLCIYSWGLRQFSGNSIPLIKNCWHLQQFLNSIPQFCFLSNHLVWFGCARFKKRYMEGIWGWERRKLG